MFNGLEPFSLPINSRIFVAKSTNYYTIMKSITTSLLLLLFINACTTLNPFTGEKTLGVNNQDLFPMTFQEYDKFLTEAKVIRDTKEAKTIDKIREKLVAGAQLWLSKHGHPTYLKDYKWESKLVEDKSVNAWCMPGGKIVFYTGILPICQTEAGIATVMGHEIAHALANHGGQRMKAGTFQQYGAMAIGLATASKDSTTQQTWQQYYGIGTNVGFMLPFSRSHETEADKIGLILMAIAGYQPEQAISFWERMDKVSSKDQNQPEFMSTHPSHNTRINTIKSLIPQAKEEAKKLGIKVL
jgi:predicted Zn-dependent protease